MWRKRDFARLRRCRPEDWLLLVEATLWLGLSRAAINVLPFRWTARLFALDPGETGAQPVKPPEDRIAWSLRAVAARAPWQSTCLVRALAGSGMLRFRGIPATIALGVAKSEGAPASMIAHAWLSCGGVVITGAAGHEQYRVIAKFSSGKTRTS